MPDIRNDTVAPAPAGPALAYSQTGSGRDVVLIHGALVNRFDMLLGLGSALGESFRVTAFDRPGHGGSGREPEGLTGSPWRQAEALRAGVQALGLERPVLVGHSYGGAVAIAWAEQYPAEVGGVVALAPICFPELRLEHILFGPRATPGLGPLISGGLSAALDPVVLPALWRAMFLPQAIPERYGATFPYAEAAQPARTQAEGEDAALLNGGLARILINAFACHVPVRVLAGDRDLVVNNRLHGAMLSRMLPAGHFEELPGLGHMLHHFAQPRVADTVAQLAA